MSNTVKQTIDTFRTLCIDAVQQANSGHPGTPMGVAPVAYTLWQDVLRFDPVHPVWPGRDRFVLSAGHASKLLYALLHLTATRDTASVCVLATDRGRRVVRHWNEICHLDGER